MDSFSLNTDDSNIYGVESNASITQVATILSRVLPL